MKFRGIPEMGIDRWPLQKAELLKGRAKKRIGGAMLFFFFDLVYHVIGLGMKQQMREKMKSRKGKIRRGE